nr:PH domain-containing protein [Kibdelosporangium phytohabitans]
MPKGASGPLCQIGDAPARRGSRATAWHNQTRTRDRGTTNQGRPKRPKPQPTEEPNSNTKPKTHKSENSYPEQVIDFQKNTVFKLSPAKVDNLAPEVAPILIQGEQVLLAFKAVRDYVVFTTKRLIAVNVQGVTGKKKDYTSLPYSKIQAFSIETAGTFDLDAELDLWFSGLGSVRLEFRGGANIRQIGQLIAAHAL